MCRYESWAAQLQVQELNRCFLPGETHTGEAEPRRKGTGEFEGLDILEWMMSGWCMDVGWMNGWYLTFLYFLILSLCIIWVSAHGFSWSSWCRPYTGEIESTTAPGSQVFLPPWSSWKGIGGLTTAIGDGMVCDKVLTVLTCLPMSSSDFRVTGVNLTSLRPVTV